MSDDEERAERFADRFRAVYLTFHRRDGPRSQLQGASRAVLEHLAMAGPLTIGEAAGTWTELSRSSARSSATWRTRGCSSARAIRPTGGAR